MFEIIQAEKDFESVIDSKETQAEAQEYVSALNDTKKKKQIFFYCKEIKTQTENENEN